ncbi:hypothetical protein ABIB59_002974 [Citrobacter sp. UYEF32]
MIPHLPHSQEQALPFTPSPGSNALRGNVDIELVLL